MTRGLLRQVTSLGLTLLLFLGWSGELRAHDCPMHQAAAPAQQAAGEHHAHHAAATESLPDDTPHDCTCSGWTCDAAPIALAPPAVVLAAAPAAEPLAQRARDLREPGQADGLRLPFSIGPPSALTTSR